MLDLRAGRLYRNDGHQAEYLVHIAIFLKVFPLDLRKLGARVHQPKPLCLLRVVYKRQGFQKLQTPVRGLNLNSNL